MNVNEHKKLSGLHLDKNLSKGTSMFLKNLSLLSAVSILYMVLQIKGSNPFYTPVAKLRLILYQYNIFYI
jgi:hypothetical protein